MGFHSCAYCQADGITPEHSSGDVILVFESGRSWRCPDMILHYVLEHRYAPPAYFVADVMASPLRAGGRDQTKGGPEPEPVGYLEGSFPRTDQIHADFARKLAQVLRQASAQGDRVQTRGL
jgi:hypothetical protein